MLSGGYRISSTDGSNPDLSNLAVPHSYPADGQSGWTVRIDNATNRDLSVIVYVLCARIGG